MLCLLVFHVKILYIGGLIAAHNILSYYFLLCYSLLPRNIFVAWSQDLYVCSSNYRENEILLAAADVIYSRRKVLCCAKTKLPRNFGALQKKPRKKWKVP